MNKRIDRRALMGMFTVLGAGVAMSSCANFTTISTIAAAGFQAVATEIQLAVPQLVRAGLSGSAATSATNIGTQIAAAASAITSTVTESSGQSALVTIENLVNSLATLITPAILAAIPGGTIIGLIIAALPEIEALINFGVSLLSASASSLAASAPAPTPAPVGARFGAVVAPCGITPLERLRCAAGK